MAVTHGSPGGVLDGDVAGSALSVRDVHVTYGHVHALRGADLDCRPGLLAKLGLLDNKAMAGVALREFEQLGVRVDAARGSIREMSGGQRQGVAVARAVSWAEKHFL